MFEIKWNDKIYKFDENVSNSSFDTVKGNLLDTERLIIAMSVEPKITLDNFPSLPKLLTLKIGSKINSYLDNDEDFSESPV